MKNRKHQAIFLALALCAAAALVACGGSNSSPAAPGGGVDPNNTCGAKDIVAAISKKSGNECNSTFTLKVTVSGADAVGPYEYQWRSAGTAIEGATSSEYNAAKGEAGPFTVVVTDTSYPCTRTSDSWAPDCAPV